MISQIERIESRIAPAKLVGSVLTYTDLDGDAVKITFTKAAMDASRLQFASGGVDGNADLPQKLRSIDLTGLTGAGFTAVATPRSGVGDGFVNIETIVATDTDLGGITLDGDLHAINAGDSSFAVPGVKSLTLHSWGVLAETAEQSVLAAIGTLMVKTDIRNAWIIVEGPASAIRIGGSIIGTDEYAGGSLRVMGSVGSFSLGGSIHGGTGMESGSVYLSAMKGAVTIGGSIFGGEGDGTFNGPQFLIGGAAPTVTIGGDIIGGKEANGGSVAIDGDTGNFTVKGSVRAGEGSQTGLLEFRGNVKQVTIGRDFVGADAAEGETMLDNGSIVVYGKLGALKIGGVFETGERAEGAARNGSGLISAGQSIGSVSIGAVHGNANLPAAIVASGYGVVEAIKSMTVKGSARYLEILAGYLPMGVGPHQLANEDVKIGAVTVTGNFVGGRILVGTEAGADGELGTMDDVISGTTGTLGSVKIGGFVAGAGEDAPDATFLLAAPVFKKLTVGKATFLQERLNDSLWLGVDNRVLARSGA